MEVSGSASRSGRLYVIKMFGQLAPVYENAKNVRFELYVKERFIGKCKTKI